MNRQKIDQAIKLVRDGLASGELPMHNFNMRHWNYGTRGSEVHCGTVGCIGGWAWLALKHADLQDEADVIVGNGEGRAVPMLRLFHNYPHDIDITAQDAVKAIDNYLAGSEDPWYAPAASVSP